MLDKNVREKVLELSKQNKSLREIASELSIGKTTAASIIKKSKTVPAPTVAPKQSPEQSPEILPKPSVDMDKAESDSFLQSLLSDGPEPGPAPDVEGQTAFINGFIHELDLKEKRKPTKAKRQPVKAARAAPVMKFSELPVVRQEPAAPPKIQLEKGELVAKLTLYANTFPDALKDYIKPNKDEFIDALHKKSHNELSALLQSMDYSRSINNTAGVLKSLTLTGTALLEMGTKRFLKMRTDGFSQMIASASDLDSILKEISMENAGGIISKYQSPTVRLTTLLITTLLAVDARNRNGIQQPQSMQQPDQMAADLEQKYGEL